MSTLGTMKTRIASEFNRDGLDDYIADAITTAIDAYKYQRFHFNAAAFVDAPADDAEADNAWMTTAERLIRSRAKLEIIMHAFDQPDTVMRDNLNAEIEDALKTLRLSVSNVASVTAATLGAMKKRIANEINRSDLTDQIADAITTAIATYQNNRFWFNETRSFTFTAVIGQSIYTVSDDADIGKIAKIDFVRCETSGGQSYGLHARDPEFFECVSGTSSNIPGFYGFYDESLRLYPTPAAAYTIRVACVEKVAAPSTDVEASNPWMTHAELLIRCRAKAELYTHVDDIADDGKAQKYMTLASDALSDLEVKTVRLTKTGPSIVRAFH